MIYKSINLKWLGQSGFKIKTEAGKTVYLDPYKISEDSEIADIIFITHSHMDHCSIEDIKKIAADGTIIVCPADVSSKLRHIEKKLDIKLAEIGDKIDFSDEQISAWPVLAYNVGKNFHGAEEDWVGYIIQISDISIYHAGDTDLIPEMKKLSTANIDIALLPIGGTYTMNAGEAAKAAAIIRPKLVIPMHYDFISSAGSHIGARTDADIFMKLCSVEGIEVRILAAESSSPY